MPYKPLFVIVNVEPEYSEVANVEFRAAEPTVASARAKPVTVSPSAFRITGTTSPRSSKSTAIPRCTSSLYTKDVPSIRAFTAEEGTECRDPLLSR